MCRLNASHTKNITTLLLCVHTGGFRRMNGLFKVRPQGLNQLKSRLAGVFRIIVPPHDSSALEVTKWTL